MRKIEFKAGYYEWHLFIDDELVYVFGDSVNENFETKEELKAFISELMRCLDDEAKENEEREYFLGFCDYYGKRKEMKELWLSLTQKERDEVERQFIFQWQRYCLTDYEVKKAQVRQKAIDYQLEASERCLSYSELAQATEHFERLGKRYGLLKEFKENGIL